MLKIEILDPGSMPKVQLMALVALLSICAERDDPLVTNAQFDRAHKGLPPSPNLIRSGIAPLTGGQCIGTINANGSFTDPETLANSFTIAPNDNPSTGAMTEEDDAAAQALAAFGGGVPAIPNVFPQPPANVLASAPAPAVCMPVAHADVDKAGLPWDARIHSSNHEKNAGDGLWRARRNVDKALVATVEAELRSVMSIPSKTFPQATGAILGSVPAPPQLAANVIPQAIAGSMSYADLASKVMAEVTANRKSHAELLAACVLVGLPNFPSLHARPDLVDAVHTALFPNG